jgi:hypothetical protein
MFWDSENTESSCYDPEDDMDNVCEGDIIEFEQAKRLPNFFGVIIDDKTRFFDTLEEVHAAIKEAENGTI